MIGSARMAGKPSGRQVRVAEKHERPGGNPGVRLKQTN
jgi:hypothetical protein